MKKNIMTRWIKQVAIAGAILSVFAACNKELPKAEPIVQPTPTGQTIADIINTDANFSILKAAVTKAGLTNLLSDKSAVFTVFAPDDNAFIASGIPAAAISVLSKGLLDTVLKYHIIGGQKFTAATITPKFPNYYLQSSFILAPPSAALPPGLRMPLFPSNNVSTIFVNNIPVTQADIQAANGVIHKVAYVVSPPSQVLYQRIATDPDLTYLLAAINKADQGVTPASATLAAALQNAAANLTVFAPTNLAFQQILTALITQALIAQGTDPTVAAATAATLASTPAVFNNPALATVLTPQTVQGIVVYHLFGNRAFSVNMPVSATSYPTILNTVITSHPGVALQATFGAGGVSAATIKGVANPTAANILINPTPAPAGTSDQHYINGVLHKIDQVLLPQ